MEAIYKQLSENKLDHVVSACSSDGETTFMGVQYFKKDYVGISDNIPYLKKKVSLVFDQLRIKLLKVFISLVFNHLGTPFPRIIVQGMEQIKVKITESEYWYLIHQRCRHINRREFTITGLAVIKQ